MAFNHKKGEIHALRGHPTKFRMASVTRPEHIRTSFQLDTRTMIGVGKGRPSPPSGRVEDWRGAQESVSNPRLVKRSMQISGTTLTPSTSYEGSHKKQFHQLSPSCKFQPRKLVHCALTRCGYNIRTLFYHAGYEFELKNYIPHIVNFIYTWQEFKQLSIKDDVPAMAEVLKESERVGPDCLGKIEGNIPPDLYGYDIKTENFFVSTKDILEGYARVNELIELLVYSSNIFRPIDGDENFETHVKKMATNPFKSTVNFSSIKYTDEFFDKSLKGEYGNVLYLFLRYVWPDNNRNLLDCIYTAAYILELSLMTSFQSALLSDSSFSYSQFLVPHRFDALCYTFKKLELSFSKLCSYFDNESIIESMDSLCENIGWVKYSACLGKLFECTFSDKLSTPFHRPAAQKVIKFKKEKSVFPACRPMLIPGTVFFTDECINYRPLPVADPKYPGARPETGNG